MASLKELLAAKAARAATADKGVSTVSTPPPPASGIVIRPSAEPAVTATVNASQARPLGETTAEPDVPFEFASEKSSEAQRLWLAARQFSSTQLGIYLEPAPSCQAWLALDLPEDPGRLLLLYRLPLLTKRDGAAPF